MKIPDGWQLVPAEPTFEMCVAGKFPWSLPRFPSRYKAMLAAAPVPPTPVSSPRDEEIERLKGEITALSLSLEQPEQCEGADDPEERCPRYPKDCKCWQVDLNHPTMALSDRSGSGDAVRVKALEWKGGESRSSLGDLYSVFQLSENVFQTLKNGTAFPSWKPTLNEAKAAAQADYETRIRSALVTSEAGRDELIRELVRAARAFMDLFVIDNGEDRSLSNDGIDMVELTHRFAALEDATKLEVKI